MPIISRHFARRLPLIGLLLAFAPLSYAKLGYFRHESLPVDPDARLQVGLNASYNQFAYNQDDDVTVLPQAFYDNNRWYLEGNEGGYYVHKDELNQWRATLNYEGRRFKAKDADTVRLHQLDDRDWSVLAGTSFMHITPYGGLKAQIATDVLGRSHGTTVKLSHLSRFRLLDDKVTVYPELGLAWYDKKYNDYYFGINDKEAKRSGLNTYKPSSGVSPFATVSVNYAINPKLGVFFSQRLDYLSSEQHNSPLVDDRWDSRSRIGFNYKF